MENINLNGKERQWRILWAPSGFGNNTVRLIDLWTLAKVTDSGCEIYYPTYMDYYKNKEVMVPLFPNYAFIKCFWHMSLEVRLRDESGLYITFLSPVGSEKPYVMRSGEMDQVKKTLEERSAIVREWWHVGDFVVGDTVFDRGRNLTGTIMYFLPPSRVMIETSLFKRQTPVPVKIADLEKL